MALEAVVYPQDPFSYANNLREFYSFGGGGGGGVWNYEDNFGLQQEDDKPFLGITENSTEQGLHANWDPDSSPDQDYTLVDHPLPAPTLFSQMEPPRETSTTGGVGRRKRRRTRSSKNREEMENQRMTHIAVERNRRKQMNEYLAVLRSLMPPSYVQRGDQASIIGGAINFVKELEQLLQSTEAQKKSNPAKQQSRNSTNSFTSPFAEFFTFPQYSTRATQCNNSATTESTMSMKENVADIEVNMVESHANLKILSKKQPKQLLKMVDGLQSLHLTVLHLNVTTTLDHMVLYSVSVKIEEGCQLNTVEEIAAAVDKMLCKIKEEAAFS